MGSISRSINELYENVDFQTVCHGIGINCVLVV